MQHLLYTSSFLITCLLLFCFPVSHALFSYFSATCTFGEWYLLLFCEGGRLGPRSAPRAVAAVPRLDPRERTGGSVGWSARTYIRAMFDPKVTCHLVDRSKNPRRQRIPGESNPCRFFWLIDPLSHVFPIFFLHNPKLRPPMSSQSIAVHLADEENDGYLNKAFSITKIHGEHDSRSSIDGAHDNS